MEQDIKYNTKSVAWIRKNPHAQYWDRSGVNRIAELTGRDLFLRQENPWLPFPSLARKTVCSEQAGQVGTLRIPQRDHRVPLSTSTRELLQLVF